MQSPAPCAEVMRVPVYWTAGTQAARDEEVPAPLTSHVCGHFPHKEHPQCHLDRRVQGAASTRACSLLRRRATDKEAAESGKESAARRGWGGDPVPGTTSLQPRRQLLGLAREDSAQRTMGLPSPGPGAR